LKEQSRPNEAEEGQVYAKAQAEGQHAGEHKARASSENQDRVAKIGKHTVHIR
jgi:hypothetical protein